MSSMPYRRCGVGVNAAQAENSAASKLTLKALVFTGDVASRLTTASSATVEHGAAPARQGAKAVGRKQVP